MRQRSDDGANCTTAEHDQRLICDDDDALRSTLLWGKDGVKKKTRDEGASFCPQRGGKMRYLGGWLYVDDGRPWSVVAR